MDSSNLQHALQLHFTLAMYALTRRQNSVRKLNDEIFHGNSQAQANNTVTRRDTSGHTYLRIRPVTQLTPR